MSFSVENINLTVRDANGDLLTGRVYSMDGIDRKMSMGQLVMAICLQRAATVEADLITLMEEMSNNTAKLENMTSIQSAFIDWQASASTSATCSSDLSEYLSDFEYNGTTYYANGSQSPSWLTYLTNVCGVDSSDLPSGTTVVVAGSSTVNYTYSEVDTIISVLSDKMDSLNSVSQEQLISMQSLTNKRDQSYDMVSNILKSLHTTLVTNANNL